MKRPSFQFYPADWRNNAKLRRCSWAARGVWIEVMGLLHDSDSYGILRWNLKEIALAIGCPISLIKELVSKEVLKGCDKGLCEPLIYTPRSGRKDGKPVTLIAEEQGPIWFSSRMVRDEYVRTVRGQGTRFTSENSQISRKNTQTEREKLRQKVFDKTGGKCFHCDALLSDDWEIDHLIPRSKGGRHTCENMVPSCIACNQQKSDTMPVDFTSLESAPTRRQGEYKDDAPTRCQSDGSSSSSSSSYIPTNRSLSQDLEVGGPVDNFERRPDKPPDRHVAIAVLLRGMGVKTVTSSHPQAVKWANDGRVTDEVLRAAVEKAMLYKPLESITPAYLKPIVDDFLNPRETNGDRNAARQRFADQLTGRARAAEDEARTIEGEACFAG